MEENLHLKSSLVEIKSGKKSYSLILFLASIQIAGGYLLEWTPNIVSLIFIGHNGNDVLLSALGLGVMWANVFGFGVYTGLAAGLETITAQAFGSKSYKTTSLQFWQCFWIIILLMIPISILMIASKYILALLSVEEDVSSQAADVCIGYIYAIMMNGFYAMTKGFLNGQYIYGLTLITQIVTASSHVLSCYIFIIYLDWGLTGVIIARSITETLNLLVIWIVIFIKNCCKDTLEKPNTESFKGWGEFLSQTVPIGLLYLLEWIGYEMYTFQASLLSTQSFAACVVLNNFGSFYYQIAQGISIAGSTFIGNSMGANQPKDAQEFSKTGLKITFFFILITLIPLYFLKHQFANMFTTEKTVQDEMVGVFLIFCLSMANDSLQVMLTGIVRSIGYENVACYTFLALYLGVGQILCYLLSQTAGLDLMGIILATLTTVSVYDLIILLLIVTAKWDKKAVEIQACYQDKEAKFTNVSNDSNDQAFVKYSLQAVEK